MFSFKKLNIKFLRIKHKFILVQLKIEFTQIKMVKSLLEGYIAYKLVLLESVKLSF